MEPEKSKLFDVRHIDVPSKIGISEEEVIDFAQVIRAFIIISYGAGSYPRRFYKNINT